MNKELIINVTPSEIAIALFEDKQLVELNKEKCKTGYSVGDIYLGKVKKIMPRSSTSGMRRTLSSIISIWARNSPRCTSSSAR